MQEVFEKIIDKLKEYKYENFVERNSEQIQHCKDVGDCEGIDCLLCVFNKAIEIVKQEAEKLGTDTNVGSNGWIPCGSGVMPRANGWYLVTNHLGVVQEQRWSANHWEKLRDDAVLAWRELPLPYQPKGE